MKKNTRLSSGRIRFSSFFPKRTYEMDNQTLIWNVKIYDGTGGQPIAGCPLPFPATLCLPVPHYSKMARDNCNGCSQRLSISIPLSEKTLPWKSVRSPWEPCPVAPQSRYSGTGCMDWENSLRHRHRFHNL